MENFNTYVGNLLKELREAKRLSQQTVADRLKKNRALISYWESGSRQMNIGDFILYLDAIGATEEEKSDIAIKLTDIRTPKRHFSFGFEKEDK